MVQQEMFRQQINVDRAVSSILKTDMSLRGAVPFFEIPYPTQKALRNEITIKSAGHPTAFRW